MVGIRMIQKKRKRKYQLIPELGTTSRLTVPGPHSHGGGRVERRCWVNFQCRGVLLVWMIVGQGPIALAVGAGRGGVWTFFLSSIFSLFFLPLFGRGGGRVVRWSWVNFQCRGVLLVCIRIGQGPTALAVGAGGGCLDIFTLIYPFSSLSPSLWETTRYRLKYCLKGSLSPKITNQPTNQLIGRRPDID